MCPWTEEKQKQNFYSRLSIISCFENENFRNVDLSSVQYFIFILFLISIILLTFSVRDIEAKTVCQKPPPYTLLIQGIISLIFWFLNISLIPRKRPNNEISTY